MQFLEPREVLAVLRVAKAKGASEVYNLRLDDVDLRKGNIVVKRLKGSLRTTEHRREPLLNVHRAIRNG